MKCSLYQQILLLLFCYLSSAAWAQAPMNFLQRDSDRNGRLDFKESRFESERFERLDRSKNGEISLGEFFRYWSKNGPKPHLQNLPYDSESPRQTLDLYLPSTPKRNVPLVLWLHGGSWSQGSKEHCPISSLTDHGIAVASINYRLTSEAPFPAQVEDCKKAIEFLNKNSLFLDLKVSETAAVGLSAGGHLALMLAAQNSVDKAVPFGSPVNLNQKLAKKHHRKTLEALIGGPLEENLDKLDAASPISQFTGHAADLFIFHGLDDRTVPYSEALNLAKVVAKSKNALTLCLVPGGSHTLVGGPEGWRQLVQFLSPDQL